MRARTYKDAIAALNTLQSNFASIEATRKLGPNVNKNELLIKEVYEYTRRLGYLPLDFNKLNVIHITGTKGKGSTAAFTESILRKYIDDGTSSTAVNSAAHTNATSSGSSSRTGPKSSIHKIGLYTSPHLKSVRERIRINGNPINELKFLKYFFEVWDKLSATQSDPTDFPTLQPSDLVKPMYFKYLTILSFHVFMLEGVDTAIYEVGVGGTYDSTNIIEKPTVTGILSLGIDHTFMLGNTVESITENKTGIFKRGCPAVVSDQREYPQTIPLIQSRAKELGVSQLDIVHGDTALPPKIKLGLAGDFQRQNAALAVQLAGVHLKQLGFKPTDLPELENGVFVLIPDNFLTGLEETRWNGRCQVIELKPEFERINWYIDGAHTMESINVASQWFTQQTTGTTSATKKKANNLRVLLFNQQGRENATALLTKLHQIINAPGGKKFDHAIFSTNVTWSDGNYSADLVSMNSSKDVVDRLVVQKEFAECWNKLDQQQGLQTRKHIFHDIETSVNYIKSLTDSLPSTREVDVFVCGSLHLVGGFLVVLDNDRD
ncbi:Folylpolyglutamate synthetase [Scheffersomyces spartinae]|uniref:Folylpolyglutamate synthase n=1 Tax=Scheffersomyces spartinae TaxID=45513 RepID=A0A9P7V7G1_9ASCO|nr:Folylpolyglutamate synthetase [Scheffersomyces spartinae]KAG7192306.1 Folylpolyglutamate synthetase [Scheffersomyces spartinae]